MAKKSRKKIDELQQPDGEPQSAAPRKVVPVAARPAPASDDVWHWLDDAIGVAMGLLCLFLPRVVEPGIRDLFQLPKQLLMAEAAVWFTGLLAVLAWVGRPIRLPRSPMLPAAGVMAAAIALSMAVAPDETGGVLSIFARYDAHRWAAAGMLFLITLVGLGRPRRFVPVAVGLMLGGLWVSLIGIGEQHDIAGLLPREKWAIISKPGSTFGNRNMAAQTIVALVPACYAVLAMALRWYTQHKVALALAVAGPTGIVLALNLYYLKLTVTRSAWIGLVLGVMVGGTAFLLGRVMAERRRVARSEAQEQQPGDAGEIQGKPRRSRLVPLVVALGLGVGLVAGASYVLVRSGFNTPIDEGDSKRGASTSELLKSTFDTNQNAAQWRFGMWASTVEAIKAHPLGRGPGNWRVIYPQFVTQREKNEMFTIGKQPIRAHQDFLQFGSEFGVHGLLALLALIGMAVWLTARATAAAAEKNTDGAAWLAYGSAAGVAAIFGICGDALFSFPLQLPAPTFLFALHLGVIGAAEAQLCGRKGWGEDDTAARGPQPASASVKWGLSAVAVGGLMFLNGFGSWEGLHPRWMVAEHGFTDGRRLQKIGRASEGLTEIRKAIHYNPDDFQNHFIEGLNLNSLGRTQEAIASIEASLRLYPYLLNAWVNLAMFNARLDNDKQMNAAIDRALELKPDELVALNVRADWLMERGKHKEAHDLLARHVAPPPGGKVDPRKPLHKMSYVEYRMAGNFPPDDGQIVAQYIRTLKNATKAAKQLERWNDVAAYTEALLREPIPNDGRSEFDKRIEWMRRHGDMADALGKAGRWPEALDHARLAAELAQSDKAGPKIQYAVALGRNGDVEGAKREFRIGVRMDKGLLPQVETELTALKRDVPAQAAKWDAILAEVKAL